MSSYRPIFLVIGTVAANLAFLLLSPNFVVPPRLSEQMDKALLTLGLSLVPFVWGLYLLFTYRSFKERILAYSAIAISLLWIGTSTNFLVQVIKERRIYRSNIPAAGKAGIALQFASYIMGPACLSRAVGPKSRREKVDGH